MPAWLIPALGLAAQGLGLINKNKRQREQQYALNEDAMGQNRRMGEWNYEQQMKMWEETGPAGMAKQFDKAGLNRALMYGGAGAGGQSSNAAQAEGVKAGQAQGKTGNEEAQISSMAMGLANQVALQEAQIENIKADTEVKKQDAAATGGYKQELAGAQTEATKYKAAIDKVGGEIAEEMKWQAMGKIQMEYEKIKNETDLQVQQKYLTQEQQETIIATSKAQLAGILANNILTKSKTELTEEQIKAVVAGVEQKWKELELKGTEVEIKDFEAMIRANYPNLGNALGAKLNEGLEEIIEVFDGENRRPRVERRKK